jgi:hypothetical protein
MVNGLLQTLWDAALFATLTFGYGLALTPAWRGAASLRFCIGVAFGLGVQFLIGFAAFAAGVSNRLAAIAMAVALVAALLVRRRAISAFLRDQEIRRVLAAWLLFAGWSLGLLALVKTYSGGGWAIDWVEHWQRTRFFMERMPADTLFANVYPLTARPPLVNRVLALWLEATPVSFADYQALTTLFGSLILLPGWLLAERWRRGAGPWVVLVLMLSPLVAQNLTFAWTKLPTAFFVLTAIVAALAGLERDGSARSRTAAALCLGLALVAHYSAGPWMIAAAVGLAACVARRGALNGFWREAALLSGAAAVVPLVWLAWAVHAYGLRATLGANTTVDAWSGQGIAERVEVPILNLADTLVPVVLRSEPNDHLLTQGSQLGRLRDFAFSTYQLNLPLAFGFGGLLVLGLFAMRSRRAPANTEGVSAAPDRRFFAAMIPIVVVLGVAVHTQRDHYGLTHICLQPLVVLGLARIAAALPVLPRRLLALWGALLAIDVILGIVLQFGMESWAFAGVVEPGGGPGAFLARLGRVATVNAIDKQAFGFTYVSDRVGLPVLVLASWLALCVLAAIVLIRRNRPAVG